MIKKDSMTTPFDDELTDAATSAAMPLEWLERLHAISASDVVESRTTRDFAETQSEMKHLRHKIDMAMVQKRIPMFRRVEMTREASMVGAGTLTALCEGELRKLLYAVQQEMYW